MTQGREQEESKAELKLLLQIFFQITLSLHKQDLTHPQMDQAKFMT